MLVILSCTGGFKEHTAQILEQKGKKGKSKASEQTSESTSQESIKLVLEFKRFIFDPKKKMEQL